MPRKSERILFIGLALLVLGLAAVGSGFGGRERPFLIFLLVGGVVALWLVARRDSVAPDRWRNRRSDGDDASNGDEASK
jgi:hypothetical protein